ncbi:MAG: hypothetical protein KDJ52_03890, partial [Anaerolineae bacterium]|nr:hypothetical protein [Anaerolineae bacterium]
KAKPKPAAKKIKRPVQASAQAKKVNKKPVAPKPKVKSKGFLGLSRATIDVIVTIAFVGLIFFFGTVIFAAYTQFGRGDQESTLAQVGAILDIQPTLRPTFTPTADPNNPNPEPPAENSLPAGVEVAAIENPNLPSPNKVPTEIPTLVPTLTPSDVPDPTDTPTVLPTDTPVPTQPPVPVAVQPQTQTETQRQDQIPVSIQVVPTDTPVVPTDTPAPAFRFTVKEQGNREFQRTNYHAITIYVAIVTSGNVPIGGLKVVGDHSSGIHIESAPSDWHWSATNCLDCDYIKFANVKFEPGTFSDGVWNIYVADSAGTPLSPVLPLSYSADPEQWVWDFVLFSES